MLTKDRIEAALATVTAVVGLVLAAPTPADDDDDD